MTASSGVVLGNLAYLIGAVVVAVIGGLIVWLRHRQPKSVDANVESFNRGLRALAPDASSPGSRRPPPGPRQTIPRIQPRAVLPTRYATPEPPTNSASKPPTAQTGGTGDPAAEAPGRPDGTDNTDDTEGTVVDLSSAALRDPTPVRRAGAETG